MENRSLTLPLLLLAAACCVCMLLGGNALRELPQVLLSVRGQWLGAALAAMVVFFIAQGLNVKWLFASMGYTVSCKTAVSLALVDFYFSAITPCASGGQPAQLYFMAKRGLPLGASSLVILLFNMTYHGAALILTALAFWLKGALLRERLGLGFVLLAYGAAVHLALALLFALAICRPQWLAAALAKVLAWGERVGFLANGAQKKQALAKQLAIYQAGAAHLKGKPWTLVRCQMVTVVHLLALFSIPYCLYQALGLSGLGYLDLTALQSVFAQAVDTLPLPGGLGAAEGGFVLLYGAIFGGKVFSAMLLYRAITYYGPLALGALAALGAQFGSRR